LNGCGISQSARVGIFGLTTVGKNFRFIGIKEVSMKRAVIPFLVAGWVLTHTAILAEDAKEKAATSVKEAKQIPSQDELEGKFKTILTKATLAGRWAPIKEGALGEEKADKYEIVSVGKVSGDSWVVNAKMKYGGREFVAPFPVKMRWAGDAAVLIVDNLQMPGGQNSYSARVMFYENTYAGTWSGGGHGGMLSGLITQAKEEKVEQK
jgi:hypothetical protein